MSQLRQLRLDSLGEAQLAWSSLVRCSARQLEKLIKATAISTDELPEVSSHPQADSTLLQLTSDDLTDLVRSGIADTEEADRLGISGARVRVAQESGAQISTSS